MKYKVIIEKKEVVETIKKVDEFTIEADSQDEFIEKSFNIRKGKGYNITDYLITNEKVED